MNADWNSSLNIKNRILSVELRNLLGKDNVYQCSRPKEIYYKQVKSIVEGFYKKQDGVVTELLPNESNS